MISPPHEIYGFIHTYIILHSFPSEIKMDYNSYSINVSGGLININREKVRHAKKSYLGQMQDGLDHKWLSLAKKNACTNCMQKGTTVVTIACTQNACKMHATLSSQYVR